MLRIVHTPAEGTVLEGTRRGDDAITALRAAGLHRWRWSRQIGPTGAWYLPGTRDQVPPSDLIARSADVLRTVGFEVITEVDTRPRPMAEAEADRAQRLDDRADRLAERADRHAQTARGREDAAARLLGGIPPGQPILVGHHSEARHRRDLDRADAHERAARDHDRRAADAARAAATAAGHMWHRESPQVVAGRLERLTAERRRVQRALDGHTRTRRRADGAPWRVETRDPATGTARERLLVQAEHLDEQIRHWSGVQAEHRSAGRIDTVDWDRVRPGDLLQYRGRWEQVRRVNKVTVTVVVEPGWNDKIPRRGVTAHRPAPQSPGHRAAACQAERAARTGRTDGARPATDSAASASALPGRHGGPTQGPGL